MFRVLINRRAESDMQAATDWWKENRSTAQAERWYAGIYKAIQTLNDSPMRCSHAPEDEFSEIEIRQLLFGVSNKPTHRVLFYVDGDAVVIFRVLHTSQAPMNDPG